jgi:hypothetical protein
LQRITPALDLEIALIASSPSDEQKERSLKQALLIGAIELTVTGEPFLHISYECIPTFSIKA